MVWQTQRGGPWGGGGGGGQGPWGGSGQGGGPRGGPQPPDIEEMLRRSQDKFKKIYSRERRWGKEGSAFARLGCSGVACDWALSRPAG